MKRKRMDFAIYRLHCSWAVMMRHTIATSMRSSGEMNSIGLRLKIRRLCALGSDLSQNRALDELERSRSATMAAKNTLVSNLAKESGLASRRSHPYAAVFGWESMLHMQNKV